MYSVRKTAINACRTWEHDESEDNKDILTIKALHKLLNKGRNTALQLVQDDDVEPFKVGKQWTVTNESAGRYIRRCSILKMLLI